MKNRSMHIQYAPTFVRAYKCCPQALKEEIKEKISVFQNPDNHKVLKIHKLKGALSDTFSFSVNYKIRIVFDYGAGDVVILLYVGSHDDVY